MPSSIPTPPRDGWRSLTMDPATNRLLRQIYGTQASIDYPACKSVPRSNLPAPPFTTGSMAGSRGGGASVHSAAAAAVPVPKFRGPRVEAPAPIDYAAPRRRKESEIKRELDRTRTRNAAYRPPAMRAVSTEAEKSRLTERFTYGGGKALPEELTHPEGLIPHVEAAKRKEQERVAQVLRRRSGQQEPASAPAQPESADAQLFDQIAQEVEERQAHLATMRTLGVAYDRERQLLAEIGQRTDALRRLQERRRSGGGSGGGSGGSDSGGSGA